MGYLQLTVGKAGPGIGGDTGTAGGWVQPRGCRGTQLSQGELEMAFQSLLGLWFAGNRGLTVLFTSQGRFLITVLVL